VNRKDHWNHVYQTKRTDDLSWTQQNSDVSLELIEAAGVSKEAGIIDVGGGTSRLVGNLIEAGYSRLAVLDISRAALSQSQSRLAAESETIEWFEADVTSFKPPHTFGLWHDRAVFHFLTEPHDRHAYVATLRQTLQPTGAAIIATFALDGPLKCSGLDVMRHDERTIRAELGTEFQIQEVRRETHITPWQSEQRFVYFRFKRES
jgi:SAM-dependent methyltransferase